MGGADWERTAEGHEIRSMRGLGITEVVDRLDAVVLRFGSHQVALSGSFELVRPGERVADVATLIGQVVSGVVTDSRGQLLLSFAEGSRISAPSGSWAVAAHGRWLEPPD